MKKFLTVLLVIAVMFTFSFGSAFAAPSTPSTSASASQMAFSKVVADALKTISYDGNGYVGKGFADAADGNYLSKKVIEDVAAELEANYLAKIGQASSNWDNEWSDADTTTKVIGKLEATPYIEKMWAAQVEIEKNAAYAALSPDLNDYTKASQTTINGVIDTQTAELETAIGDYNAGTNDKDTIDAFKDVITAVDDALKAGEKSSDSTSSIAEATTNATKALAEKSAAFVDAVETAYATPANTDQAAKLASLNNDVDKMVAFYEDIAIAYGKIDSTNTAMDTTAKVVDYLNSLAGKMDTTFSTSGPYTAFYSQLALLKTGDFVVAALEKDAAAKKAERDADGTLKYKAVDVDKALADEKVKVNETLRDDILNGNTGINSAPTTLTLTPTEYGLQPSKEQAIDDITTGDYVLTNWSGERADKVEAIQDDYSEQILLAKSVDEIDTLVEEAQDKMDAILTKAQITALKTKVGSRVTALGYNTMLGNYYDAVIGSNGYGAAIRTDAIENAIDLLKDAVIAKENAKITYAEIDQILKENRDAAIAKVIDVKTKDELKSEAAALKTMFDSLPTTVTTANKAEIIAAQEAMDAYDALPGAEFSDVSNAYKLSNAMKALMTEEAKAVNAQIKNLPATITVADEAAIKAAREAYDALEETYGDYDDEDAPYNYLGAAIQTLVTRSTALTKAEAALEVAKVEDAAKKIEALNENSTSAEVAAAKAAYDALKTESKLKFNTELLDKLEKALKVVENADIKAVEALKIKASSTVKKGSITVKWTVKGDTSAVKGYEIWKSTKRSSGFKKAFTQTASKQTYKNTKGLKKGTRYYYKVRAIAYDAAGNKVTSDWSNKAYRIAK